jgi:hypothetical protein
MRSKVHPVLGTWLIVAGLLLGSALTGCKTADLYRPGYDKRLTQKIWAARGSDDAVVIIGGYPSVWQKADDPNYQFEARSRFKIDWSHTFDAALVKAGTYQLQTLVLPDSNFADFGGFQGLGAKYSAQIATFQVGPGQVVYVGDLDAEVLVEAIGTCSANLSAGDTYAGTVQAFAKQVPYVGQQPTISMLTVNQSLVRFPCGQAY